MDVPESIVNRMVKTPKAAQPEQGICICDEIIEQVRQMPGVSGIHIMAVHWAEAVPEIVMRAGLYPGPARARFIASVRFIDHGRHHARGAKSPTG